MKRLLQHRAMFNLMQKCDFLTATKKIPHVNMHNLQSALFNSYLLDGGKGQLGWKCGLRTKASDLQCRTIFP